MDIIRVLQKIQALSVSGEKCHAYKLKNVGRYNKMNIKEIKRREISFLEEYFWRLKKMASIFTAFTRPKKKVKT